MPLLSRRSAAMAVMVSWLIPQARAGGGAAPWRFTQVAAFQRWLAQLERNSGGRLGVHVIHSGTGQQAGHRSDERFLMLSSFKTLAAALVLARHDRGKDQLDRRIPIQASDLIEYAPVVERHVGASMTLAELCQATLTTSDNAAANLILASYGGPAALTRFVRSLGDQVTRHDRTEPTLNTPDASATLDTTTPRAMASTLRALLFGNALSPAARQQLQDWLSSNTTGGPARRPAARLARGRKNGHCCARGRQRRGLCGAGAQRRPQRAPTGHGLRRNRYRPHAHTRRDLGHSGAPGGAAGARLKAYQRPASMRMATSQSSNISSLAIFTRTPSTPGRSISRAATLPIRLSSRLTCRAVHSSMTMERTRR